MQTESKAFLVDRHWEGGKVITKVREHLSVALSAAGIAGAHIAARVGTMTAAVAKNLATRRGNIPAAELFARIPQGVRVGGEKSILSYLKSVDLSHLRSVKNSPKLAHSADNVLFEPSALNQARGARNMTAAQVAKAKGSNALVGLGAGLRSAPKAAMRSGLMAVALELPVSGTVNLIRYRRGRVSGKKAAINTTKDVITTSLVGAVLGGGTVVAVALGAPVTGAAMVVLSGIGLSGYGVSSVRRIYSATVEA